MEILGRSRISQAKVEKGGKRTKQIRKRMKAICGERSTIVAIQLCQRHYLTQLMRSTVYIASGPTVCLCM